MTNRVWWGEDWDLIDDFFALFMYFVHEKWTYFMYTNLSIFIRNVRFPLKKNTLIGSYLSMKLGDEVWRCVYRASYCNVLMTTEMDKFL